MASGQGVLVNDTLNQGSISQFQTSSARGGIVVLNADGSFVYTPPTGQGNATDTFTYTLDNGFGASTATVTITLTQQTGGQEFFVKNDAPAGGDGTQQFPFNTLAAALTAAGNTPGAQIVVFRGNGTSSGLNGQVTLQVGQTLRGFDAANRPTLTGPVKMASNSTLADVRVVDSPINGVVVSEVSDVTVRNVAVIDSTGDAFNLLNPSGTNTFQSVAISSPGDDGVDYNQSTGTATLNWTGLTLTGAGGHGVSIQAHGPGTTNWNETGTRLNVPSTLPTGHFDGDAYFLQVGSGLNDTTVFNARFSDVVVDRPSRFGMRIASRGRSRLTYVFDGGGVRNATFSGLSLLAADDSTFLARVSNSDINSPGAAAGLDATSESAADICLRVINVVSNGYRWAELGATSTFTVENLANFNTENQGQINATGTITAAAIGECGIP